MLPHWLLLHFGQINDDDDDDDDDDDCLGGAAVRRWTRDRKVAGSTPGRGAIKSIRSTSIPPG